MRAVLGNLGFMARLCRPELAYRCSALQGKQSKPTLTDLIATNKFLAAAQKTNLNGIKFKRGAFDFNKAELISVTDASHAAEVRISDKGKATGHRLQAGRFLLFGDGMPTVEKPANIHVLDWSSHTIKRVCRSTLQIEVPSSVDGCEMGHYVRSQDVDLLHALPDGAWSGISWVEGGCQGQHGPTLAERLSLVLRQHGQPWTGNRGRQALRHLRQDLGDYLEKILVSGVCRM